MAQLGFKGALRPVFAAAVLLLPAAAMAQEAAAPASPPGVGTVQPTPGEAWVKVCAPEPNSKKQLCQVIQQLVADNGQLIASVNVQTLEGEPKKRLAALVPMVSAGLVVGAGLRVQVDDGKQYAATYGVCFPQACAAEMDIDDSFVNAMKAGGQLTLVALSQQGKTLSFPLTLVGFTKAYDGEGIDPAAAQARRDDLAKSLKAHAEEARQKLLEQQKAAGAQ